jgi:hypothetical protein
MFFEGFIPECKHPFQNLYLYRDVHPGGQRTQKHKFMKLALKELIADFGDSQQSISNITVPGHDDKTVKRYTE